jgi:hypothetical protein
VLRARSLAEFRSGLASSSAIVTESGATAVSMMGSTAGSYAWKSLVEVEGGVDLGLATEQFLQMRFVLERPVGLGGQRFSSRLDLSLLVLGGLVEGANCARRFALAVAGFVSKMSALPTETPSQAALWLVY